MSIDLLLVGPDAATELAWSAGKTVRGEHSVQGQGAALAAWLASTTAEALLLWDPRLGSPDPALVARLVAGRGDVWHGGLVLGTQGQPGMIDFVAPAWMFNADPPVAIEARQTGVSDGNVDTARPSPPRSTSMPRWGAPPLAIAVGSVSGARPSTTIRTSFLRLPDFGAAVAGAPCAAGRSPP